MSCFRILANNYADTGVYANLLVSSEQANFPSTNAMAKTRRSKVWRSGGYFEVVDGDNTISFKDVSGGATKVATVTAGIYTSATTFMAAIDSAFEAAGSANYTVTQNANLKFVITSDISGGATHFEILWTSSSDMAELLGFDDAVNDTGAVTYTADFLRINSEEFITFDLGLASEPNAFAMTGYRNRSIKLSATGTFKLQGSATNNWDAPVYDETLTYDDEVIASISETQFYADPLRYWRISFQDQNPNGYVEIGSIFLGQYFLPERAIATFPLGSQLDDRTTIVFSEGGQSFADIQEKTQKFSINWKILTKNDIESALAIWNEYGKHYPLFVSFDTDGAFSSSFNRMLKYVRFDSEPTYALESPNNFSMTLNFREDL